MNVIWNLFSCSSLPLFSQTGTEREIIFCELYSSHYTIADNFLQMKISWPGTILSHLFRHWMSKTNMKFHEKITTEDQKKKIVGNWNICGIKKPFGPLRETIDISMLSLYQKIFIKIYLSAYWKPAFHSTVSDLSQSSRRQKEEVKRHEITRNE